MIVTMPAKPTPEQLGISVDTLEWRRSGQGAGVIEVAFAWAGGQQWTLMRVTGDPDGRILVFSRFEWDCFLDGTRKSEFDDAAPCRFPG